MSSYYYLLRITALKILFILFLLVNNNMRRFIPQETKEKARKLIMGGTTRKDAAFILKR